MIDFYLFTNGGQKLFISMSTDLRCYCFVQMLPILINKHLQLAILARNALSTRKDLPASCIFY